MLTGLANLGVAMKHFFATLQAAEKALWHSHFWLCASAKCSRFKSGTSRSDTKALSKRTFSAACLTVPLFSAFALGLALDSGATSSQPQVAGASSATNVSVIVELFTSEGCSSCPPAEALLATFEAQQPISHAQVIALEEHVDYWNNLGWVDPFSSSEWTERQQEYAATLGNQNPYTPQIVVNGHTELVGSREQQARQVIEAAAAVARTDVSVTLAQSDKHNAARFDVSVGKIVHGAAGDAPEVWLAITEAGLHSAVSRGENSGKELKHASVVRVLRKIGTADQHKDSSFSRNVSVGLDSGWNRQNLRAVVFVQERKSRQILGAAVAQIEP
jgi:hypothetical protein